MIHGWLLVSNSNGSLIRNHTSFILNTSRLGLHHLGFGSILSMVFHINELSFDYTTLSRESVLGRGRPMRRGMCSSSATSVCVADMSIVDSGSRGSDLYLDHVFPFCSFAQGD